MKLLDWFLIKGERERERVTRIEKSPIYAWNTNLEEKLWHGTSFPSINLGSY